MNATKRFEGMDKHDKIAVSSEELQSMLSCGLHTAVQIGDDAQARIQIGKRVLWNVKKVEEYIDRITGL